MSSRSSCSHAGHRGRIHHPVLLCPSARPLACITPPTMRAKKPRNSNSSHVAGPMLMRMSFGNKMCHTSRFALTSRERLGNFNSQSHAARLRENRHNAANQSKSNNDARIQRDTRLHQRRMRHIAELSILERRRIPVENSSPVSQDQSIHPPAKRKSLGNEFDYFDDHPQLDALASERIPRRPPSAEQTKHISRIEQSKTVPNKLRRVLPKTDSAIHSISSDDETQPSRLMKKRHKPNNPDKVQRTKVPVQSCAFAPSPPTLTSLAPTRTTQRSASDASTPMPNATNPSASKPTRPPQSPLFVISKSKPSCSKTARPLRSTTAPNRTKTLSHKPIDKRGLRSKLPPVATSAPVTSKRPRADQFSLKKNGDVAPKPSDDSRKHSVSSTPRARQDAKVYPTAEKLSGTPMRIGGSPNAFVGSRSTSLPQMRREESKRPQLPCGRQQHKPPKRLGKSHASAAVIALEDHADVEEVVLDSSESPKNNSIDDDAITVVRVEKPSTIPADTFYGKRSRPKEKESFRKPEVDRECLSQSQPLRRLPRRRRSSVTEDADVEDSEMQADSAGDIRLRKPNDKETERFKQLTHRSSKTKVMARIEAANIELRGEDLSRLRGSRWLNDEIINSFVALINCRNDKHWNLEKKMASASLNTPVVNANNKSKTQSTDGSALQIFDRPRPKAHVFNTFFFARLSQNDRYDYNGVRRWLKRAGKIVSHLDLIMFPINLGNCHWVLAAIDMRAREFIYMDSTFCDDANGVLDMLHKWLEDEVRDKCGDEVLSGMKIDTWKDVVNPSYLPMQKDDGSCGIFTLYMAEFLERGVRPNFTQKNILALRWRTALFLDEGVLPET